MILQVNVITKNLGADKRLISYKYSKFSALLWATNQVDNDISVMKWILFDIQKQFVLQI